MSKLGDAIKAQLHSMADTNGDGKVSTDDVAHAIASVEAQTEHHPLAAIIITSAAASFFTWAVMRISGC